VTSLRLFVVEGNTAETRTMHVATTGSTMSEAYASVLKSLAPDADIDILGITMTGIAL
jgi:hypothetical protein